MSRIGPRLGWTTGSALMLVLAFWLIAAAAWANPGHHRYQHVGPVPAGVIQLTRKDYLIRPVATVAAAQLCLGPDQNADDTPDGPVHLSTAVPTLHDWTFVQCRTAQTFNAPAQPTKSYGQRLGALAGRPVFLLIDAIIGVLLLGPALLLSVRDLTRTLLRDRSERARRREQQAAQQKLRAADADDQRRALAAAFAKGEIDNAQFNSGLDRINALLLAEDRDR